VKTPSLEEFEQGATGLSVKPYHHIGRRQGPIRTQLKAQIFFREILKESCWSRRVMERTVPLWKNSPEQKRLNIMKNPFKTDSRAGCHRHILLQRFRNGNRMKLSLLRQELVGFFIIVSLLNASASVLYVDLNSSNPIPPYADWSTAATNIQDAVDASSPGDTVLVTNGVFKTGGRVIYGVLTNRVAIYKPIVLQSVNGPRATFIQGFQIYPNTVTNGYFSVRCVYATNGAVLSGITLTNGGTWADSSNELDRDGAGAWCETNVILTNCVITTSSAFTYGGGIFQGICYDSLITNNTVWTAGGGAYGSTLLNCKLINNKQSAPVGGGGGGASSCVLSNCSLIGNSDQIQPFGAPTNGGGGVVSSTLTNCTLLSNSTGSAGGGANSSTLVGCVISNNSGTDSGGAENCTLINCTLAGNVATLRGGGAQLGSLSNCTLIQNKASIGGGAFLSALINCTLFSNTASGSGGGAAIGSLVNCLLVSNLALTGSGGGAYSFGAYECSMTNCTIVGNTAGNIGGGTCACTLVNSIIFFNNDATNDSSTNYTSSDTLNFSCAAPLPASGAGNISSLPDFVNMASGDFHLQPNSPCINSGNNAYVTVSTDLDGNPRIQGGTVDIGAYEYQNPTSVISYAWLQQYGLPTDGSADFIDTDNDGMNNWQEWIAGTDPTNPLSVFKMLVPSNNLSGVSLNWESVSNRTYFLQSSTNPGMQPAFSTIQSNIQGQTGTTFFTDATATNSGPYFYRVGVQQ
jgi:hypothetical protein